MADSRSLTNLCVAQSAGEEEAGAAIDQMEREMASEEKAHRTAAAAADSGGESLSRAESVQRAADLRREDAQQAYETALTSARKAAAEDRAMVARARARHSDHPSDARLVAAAAGPRLNPTPVADSPSSAATVLAGREVCSSVPSNPPGGSVRRVALL